MAGEEKHIDQIIRQKFETFAPVPPESVWQHVKDKIGGQPGGTPSGNPVIMPVITGLTVILILISALLNYNTDTRITTTRSGNMEPVYYAVAGFSNDLSFQQPQQNIQGEASIALLSPLDGISEGSQTGPPENTQDESHDNAMMEPQLKTSADVTMTALAETPPDSKADVTMTALAETPPDSKEEVTMTAFKEVQVIRPEEAPILMPSYSSSGNIELSSDGGETALPYKTASLNSAYDDYMNDHRPGWSFGAFFSPEVVFYHNDSLGNNRSYGFDLNAYYRFSDYFLQSGIGIKFANDRGNYFIDYNEYLGSYDYVYEVTFDTNNQGVIPTYHTYNVDVYDSIDHYTASETKIRYTYFEIPLLFGYAKQFRNFNFYLAGGPNFSLLFNTRIEDAMIPEEQIRIVNIEQQAPTRLDVNWQLLLRAGLGYNLGDRYSIMLEPTFKYYMKSEYDFMNNAAKPYSFGIRAGLIYHLSK